MRALLGACGGSHILLARLDLEHPTVIGVRPPAELTVFAVRDFLSLFGWVPWEFGPRAIRQKDFFHWHPETPERLSIRIVESRPGQAVCFLRPVQSQERLPRQDVEFALSHNDPPGILGGILSPFSGWTNPIRRLILASSTS